MSRLVTNLLQSSRQSALQLSTVDVCEEIEKSLELIQYHLRKYGIAVVREFVAEVPTLQADRQHLQQVFLNLFTNASDAMPQGGTLTVRASAGLLKGGTATVVIEFADTGMGVASEDLPKVWDPFFTTKLEGKGTGLGLAICRRIVEEHTGTISLESKVGQGTTVRIVLPATAQEVTSLV